MADEAKPNHANDESATVPDSRKLPPAAVRALDEAEARRKAAQMGADQKSDRPQEINGPRGPEPTRYGDWERKGVASDF